MIIKTVRTEAELQAEVDRAMMEEERRVLEEVIRITAKRQARVEVMRFEKKRQVKAKRRANEEYMERMEAER